MALRPDNDVRADDISFYCNDTSSTRGGVAVLSTGASGVALDNGSAVVTYATDPSGKVPMGILMQDMVNYDLTTREPNYFKDEVQTGGKVRLATQGWVVTDKIYPGVTPAAGDNAYVTTSGLFINSVTSNRHPLVGQFLSSKDEDGYAKVRFSLP